MNLPKSEQYFFAYPKVCIKCRYLYKECGEFRCVYSDLAWDKQECQYKEIEGTP